MRNPPKVAALLAVVFHLCPARAQETPAVPETSEATAQASRAQIEEARRRMESGQVFFLQGRFAEAASEFESAFQAQPFSAFLYNAGVSYESAGDLSRAIALFERYIAVEPNERDRREVQARLTTIRERLAALPPIGETPTEPVVAAPPTPVDALPQDFRSLVSVRTTPEGARVIISNASGIVAEGESPFSYSLEQGEYRLAIQHPDFNRAEEVLRVEPGKVYIVVLNLSQGEFLGYTRVVTDVPGASVYIDDLAAGARGQTPFEAPLPVGTHQIWIERVGYERVERTIEVTVADVANVDVTLERHSYGGLRIVSNVRGARVTVDAVQTGRVPYEVQLPPGRHRVRVEADGMKTVEQMVDVERGALTPMRVRLRPAPNRDGAWVNATLAVVALGAGVTLGVMSADLSSQLGSVRDQGLLTNTDPRLNEGFAYAISADVAFGMAGVFAALATYYFLIDPLPPSSSQQLDRRDWTFVPEVAMAPSGLALSGTARFTF